MPDDDLTNPPTTYSMISRVQKRDLQIGVEPQTKLQEIEDEFRSRYPAYALWRLTVSIIRSFAIGGSGVLRWFYRLIGQSTTQVVTVEFETFGEFGDEEDTPFPINLLVTTSDGLPVAVAGSVTVIDTETGTAVEGVDYNWPAPLVIPIPMGTLSGALIPFDLDVIDNLDPENNVSVILQVGTPVNCVIGSQSDHTHVINDSDPGIYASYSFSTGTALRSVTPVEVKITVYTSDTNPTNQASSVDITDTGLGTATEGVDYNFAGPTTINIPMGTPDGTEFSFFLDVIDTAPTEYNRTVKLGLGSPVKLVPVGPNTHTQTIQPNAPVITNTTLNDATQSQLGYSDFVLVDFGTRPLANFAVTVGSLPTGLTLDNLTGEIYGDLDAGATDETFTVTVTDDDGRTDSQSFTITVYDGLTYNPGSLPDGEEGVAYNQIVNVADGKPAITISLISGVLPDGLTGVDNGGGEYEIDGTPTVPDDFSFILRATDANGAYIDITYTIHIEAAPTDYTTNMVAKYQSGNDADFALTLSLIDTWIEQLAADPTHKDITYTGGGGYVTKAAHRNNIGIDGDKVVEVLGAGEYRLPAAGVTTSFFSGANASFTLIFRIHAIVAAFGTPDTIIEAANGEFNIRAVAGPKLRFNGGAEGTGDADQSISVDTWYIARCRFDNSDTKAKVTVGDNAEVSSTAGGVAFPANDSRWYFLANSGSGGRCDACFHQIRVYNELLSDTNWGTVKTYERGLHAAIT